MFSIKKLFAAVAISLGLAGTASADCTGSVTTVKNPDGTTSTVVNPGTCPPPVYNPIPSPTNPSTVNNGGTGTGVGVGVGVGIAKSDSTAISNSTSKSDSTAISGSVSGVKTGDIGSTSSVKTGDIGSNSSVKTGDIGSNSSAKTGDSISSTGPVSVAGNNSSYSSTTTYKAAASGATALATGTQASGICSQSKGGWAIGGQALLWGASISRNSGTAYELEDVEFINADGTKRIEKRNPCAADMAAFKQMDQAAAPGATKGEKKLGLSIAREMSPVVDMAITRVKDADLDGIFDDVAAPTTKAQGVAATSAPPVVNQYNTTLVDATKGAVTKFECKNGMTLVVDKAGAPVITNGMFTCAPK